MQILAEQASVGFFKLVTENSDIYLELAGFQKDCDVVDIQDIADETVRFLNVSIKLASCLDPELKTNGFYWIDEYGQPNLKFFGAGSFSAPLHLCVYDSNAKVPECWPDIWRNSEQAQDVFRIFENKHQDWFSLFKIYETIRDDPAHKDARGPVNGVKHIKMWGGAENNESFFQTANWHRHAAYGRKKGTPNKRPDKPMGESEAFNYIGKLIVNWLNWKGTLFNE